MSIKNKSQLLIAYTKFVDVCLNKISVDELDKVAVDDIMGYGTARDEKIFSSKGTKDMVNRQAIQGAEFQMEIETTPVFEKVSASGEHAVLVDEKTLTLTGEQGVHSFVLRLTTVMEIIDGNWKAIHWHASIPQDSTSEDTFHINEWKRKNEELQRQVDEKTAELLNRNKELEIEAALERVRAAGMAMHHTSELNQLIGIVFEQLKLLGFDNLQCEIILFDKESNDCEIWPSNEKENVLPRSYHIPNNKTKFYQLLLKTWKTRNDYHSYELKGKIKSSYEDWLFTQTDWKNIPADVQDSMRTAKKVFLNWACFEHGILEVDGIDSIGQEMFEIVRRFAHVFDQTYTRFLDLKQAEVQARDAQIEAALERIRSASMAMHKSEELKNVVKVSFTQLNALGINAEICMIDVFKKGMDDLHVWGATTQQVYDHVFHVPYFNHIYFRSIGKAKSTPNSIFGFTFSKTQTQSWHNHLLGKTKIGEEINDQRKKIVLSAKSINGIEAIQKNHGIIIYNFSQHNYTQSEQDVLLRISQVFEQAYTRFLDLQKAEAQAREANIEAALERVRARAMAMHKSEELAETSSVLFEQISELGLEASRVGFVTTHDNGRLLKVWGTSRDSSGKAMFSVGEAQENIHPLIRAVVKAWREKKSSHKYILEGTELSGYYKAVGKTMNYPKRYKKELISNAKSECFNNYFFTSGFLLAVTPEAQTDEESYIMQRFAQAFDLAYKRFLDLQNAEKRARESEVEASLERVRAKAMAMHSSDDLLKTLSLLISELEGLNIHPSRCGFGRIEGDTKITELFVTRENEGEHKLVLAGKLKLEGHPILDDIYTSWEENKEYLPILKGKLMTSYYEKLKPYLNVESPPPGTVQYGYFNLFKNGGLYAWSETPYTEETLNIYRKFTSTLGLSINRYQDLKDAEARALENKRNSSLDRVRAEIASMRTTDDLERITPLIWKELTTLEVPFFRCGVFIIDENDQLCQIFLTNPEGASLAAMTIPIESVALIKSMAAAWKNKEVFKHHWNKEEFLEFTRSIMEQGYLENSEIYQGGEEPPESLALHFVPFTQGMLYVGNHDELTFDDLALVQSLAKAFSVAYSRYEDFSQLEKAKENLEITINNLKSTQAQLIQSEKMASLGELTAGIAHEIQNPLNFVNNFSEVSYEMIEEVKEELKDGDLEEVEAILKDLTTNLEKIAHHGQRASSIVRNMLDHSRASGGEKVEIDINALCDEYLRLAYHGMRAKDRNFNAELVTTFDESLPKIKVIPQDMGRVLLNLINNAFCAASDEALKARNSSIEKEAKSESVFQPKVVVSTKNLSDKIQITVSDNGPGIPEDIKDKIFQPFFTTKPTGQGTGLGLSLSYDIIKAHGGEMKVESEIGKGAVFVVSLPI